MSKLRNQTVFYYVVLFLVMPLGFLIRLFITRTTSVEVVGVIYSLISFFLLISIFLKVGLFNSLSYKIPRLQAKKDTRAIVNLVKYSFGIFVMLILFAFVGILLSFDYLRYFYFKRPELGVYILVFLIYFLFLMLSNFVKDIFVSFKQVSFFQIIQFSQLFLTLVFLVLSYLLVSRDLLFFYSLSWGVASMITFFVFVVVLLRRYPFLSRRVTWDKKLFVDHVKCSLVMFSSSIGILILNQTDVQIITYFSTMENVAFYSNSFALINTLVSVFASISMIFLPIFSELQVKKEFGKLSKILDVLYNLVFYFIMPICLVMFLFPELILKLIYGAEYVQAGGVLRFLSLFVILKIVFTYNVNFLNGLGRARSLTKIVLPVAFLNFFLNVVLIKFWGLIGVAGATVLCWFLISFFSCVVLFRELNFRLNFLKSLSVVVCSLVFVFLVNFLKSFEFLFVSNFYVNALLVLFVSYFVYLVLGYVFRVYRLRDLYVFIPTQSLRSRVERLHSKYLSFLK